MFSRLRMMLSATMGALALALSMTSGAAALSHVRKGRNEAGATKYERKDRDGWTGADIRAMNVRNGVGSRRVRVLVRQAHVQDAYLVELMNMASEDARQY